MVIVKIVIKTTKTIYRGSCTLYGKMTRMDRLEMSQNHFKSAYDLNCKIS